jgi:hypothetical protein
VLALERARARQEAQQWSADLVKNESDEEREQRKARKAANRKVKSEAPSGDEGLSTPVTGGGGSEPKKKRRKLKKGGSGAASAAASTQVSDAEDGGLFSEGEEEKPVKKVRPFGVDKSLFLCCLWMVLSSFQRGATRKRVAREDDDELAASAPRKKQ